MAGIAVVPHMVVTDAYFCLKVPMATEDPLVAIRETASCEDTLTARVAHIFCEVVAGEEYTREGKVDIRGVVLATHQMDAEEVAIESGAGPPAEFGHHYPVLGFAVATFGVKGPGIDTVNYLECVFSSDAKLYTEVGGGSGVVE